ncbi:MAG: hypothetical protein N4A44_00665 [Alphaproteobacteria bacterium]|jgi:hypothetical protein|nr:hypothetical protein [Alphaproteobacteria bacterium]
MKKVNFKKISIVNAIMKSLSNNETYSHNGIIAMLKSAGISEDEEAIVFAMLTEFSLNVMCSNECESKNAFMKLAEIESGKFPGKSILDLIFKYNFEKDDAESAMFFNINKFKKELEIDFEFKNLNEVYKKIAVNEDAIKERWDNYFSSDEFDEFVEGRRSDVISEGAELAEEFVGNPAGADLFLQDKGY